jgi:hypothetical protein
MAECVLIDRTARAVGRGEFEAALGNYEGGEERKVPYRVLSCLFADSLVYGSLARCPSQKSKVRPQR